MFFSQISFEYFLSFKNFSPTAIFACAGAYSHYTIGVEKCKPFPLKLKYVKYGKLEEISCNKKGATAWLHLTFHLHLFSFLKGARGKLLYTKVSPAYFTIYLLLTHSRLLALPALRGVVP
jgi:hypothetical protein